MKGLCRTGTLAIAIALSFTANCQAAGLVVADVLASPSMRVAHPERAVYIDVTRAGDRLVAVGERGLVLLSDDNGQHWRQAQVPVSVGLTAVQFVDARNGWALGHAGVVLASRDGGETWTLQLDGQRIAQLELEAARQAQATSHDAQAADARLQTAERMAEEGADKPLLAMLFSDERHGLVVGAYGLALRTDDAGASWRSVLGDIDNPSGFHLYAVTRQGQHWVLAGEQGYLARSDDGVRFHQLESPYGGTFFTLGSRQDGSVLVAGLKGHAFVLPPGSDTLEALPVPAPVSFSDMTRLDDGRLLLSNQAGGLFASSSQTAGLTPLASSGKPLSAVVQTADGRLVSAGFTGLSRLSLSADSVAE